jgi:ATP-binding cassette subfamily G (WHITE) protein 2 (PDR)
VFQEESELNLVVKGVADDRRKRVTIAEATLSGAPLQCWDNSTRGLDSANAVQFCKTLRTAAEFFGTTSVVAIYQAPQSAYEQFDKVCPRPCVELMSGIGIIPR